MLIMIENYADTISANKCDTLQEAHEDKAKLKLLYSILKNLEIYI